MKKALVEFTANSIYKGRSGILVRDNKNLDWNGIDIGLIHRRKGDERPDREIQAVSRKDRD